MACECVMAGVFPFFVMFTIVSVTWSGNLWGLMYLLVIIQAAGLIRGLFACVVRRRFIMIFMSLYSCLYVTSLLPAKVFAILTIRKRGWGTSGRRTMLTTYNALIPVVVWAALIIGGLIYSSVVNDYSKKDEQYYLGIGAGVYAFYWVVTCVLWKFLVQKHHMTKEEISHASQLSSQGSLSAPGGSSQGSTTGYPKPMERDIEEGSMSNALSMNSVNLNDSEEEALLYTDFLKGVSITTFDRVVHV